jgi:hypothetical protein
MSDKKETSVPAPKPDPRPTPTKPGQGGEIKSIPQPSEKPKGNKKSG